jgi:acetyltransferase-like isoleucine patch superfamily enzyme
MSFFDRGFYNSEDLQLMGFKSVGKHVLVSKISSIFGCENVSLGDHCRIDDFSVINATNGFLELGKNVHIAAHAVVVASSGVVIGDFSGMSHGAKVYSVSESVFGNGLSNPTLPRELRQYEAGKVIVGCYVVLGANSIVLPGLRVSDGVFLAAQSTLNKHANAWGLYHGIPAKRVAELDVKSIDCDKRDC